MLPYGEFKKERPDVMPSTYRDYMAYQYSKPEAGSLISIDPKRGSFTAAAGLVRGSVKGLNDPEIRLRGFKVTASELGGMYAGTQAMKATMGFLGKQSPITEKAVREEMKKANISTGEIFTPFTESKGVKPEYLETTARGTQITNPKIKEIRAKELDKFVDDVRQDFSSQGRTLQQGMKIAGDRLQRIETASGKQDKILVDPGDPTKNIPPTYKPKVSQQGKPYSEYRVGITSEQDPAKVAILKDAIGQAKQEAQNRLKIGSALVKSQRTTGQRIEDFLGGSQYRPYIAGAVGVAAALGTGYAIKKTAQKINERRVKKQDPVEYLKYKHGDFASAKEALKQPKAKGYQDLVPYVK